MATRVVKKLSPAELERNQAVLLNTGLAIGQHKGAYQMSSKDGRFFFSKLLSYNPQFILCEARRWETIRFGRA